jgi:hypothetical protein
VKVARPQKRRAGSKPVFQRWAEARLYRKTMQIAVAELRRAARTANVLEKLEALDIAEQKLRDAEWLSPAQDRARFEAVLGEIARSRAQTLDQAVAAAERLLDAAGRDLADPAAMLAPAARILAFLNHYLPEDPRVELLNARLLHSGGNQAPYASVPALHEIYHRPDAPVGCGALMGLLSLALVIAAALTVVAH